MDKHEEFQKRIMATFRLEAEENIRAMTSYLIEMEKEPTETRKEELFEVLYRSAHSLKGASRAVDYSEIESLCHAFEDVMSAVRNQEIKFNSQVLDMLFQTVDLVEKALNVMEEGPDSGLSATIANHLDNLTMVEAGLEVETPVAQKSLKAEQVADIAPETQPVTENNSEKSRQKIQKNKQKLVQKNTTLATNSAKKSQSEKAANDILRKRSGETIRISTDRLDNLLNKVEEMLSLKLNAAQQTENIQHTLNKFFAWHKEAIEISAATRNLKQAINTNNNSLNGQGRELSKLINFFESSLVQFNDFQKELNEHLNFSKQESRSADLKIETLLNEVKDLLSVPFSTLLDGFPKMLRDISKNLGKEVNFVVEGDNIEIDRRILEQLRNPLTHLLRNSIDYGVEFPDVRKKKNKPLKGRISVKIEQVENSKVEVTISDDGHGIDIEKLKTVYAEKEKKSEKEIEKVSKEELLNYMFKSGVSTSNIVTDLSGRGLGMAIVQESIQQLDGSITVETEKDKGTTFRILLPLTIVTFRGVIIELSERKFIVPTSRVLRVLKIDKEIIKTVRNKATIQVDGEVVPLVDLSDSLELPKNKINEGQILSVILELNNKKIGFIIDKIIGEQEVLVKKFNPQLTRVRNILGATILGSGEVIPILNVNDLLKFSLKNSASAASLAAKNDEGTDSQKSILIVEDSITSRTLLKSILEAAGFNVTAAVDGVDGFTKLKEGTFDAVVTDIEMPRMNGFELTEKIRADKESGNLPIVLVTSLSKREDREKGVEVGANAYIIKSNFDQNNLLEILDRLI